MSNFRKDKPDFHDRGLDGVLPQIRLKCGLPLRLVVRENALKESQLSDAPLPRARGTRPRVMTSRGDGGGNVVKTLGRHASNLSFPAPFLSAFTENEEGRQFRELPPRAPVVSGV